LQASTHACITAMDCFAGAVKRAFSPVLHTTSVSSAVRRQVPSDLSPWASSCWQCERSSRARSATATRRFRCSTRSSRRLAGATCRSPRSGGTAPASAWCGCKQRLRTLDDLFTWAHAHPGELSIGTNGVGTTPHVVLEDLFTARGLSYIHVPYKGTSEQMIAVQSGQVMVGVNSTGFGPFVDSGRLRLLATFGAQRTKRWPQVPTLRDLGFDIVAMSPFGLGGPRGMPGAVVSVLHDAFKAALFDPAVVQELAKYDQEPAYLGSADYALACREAFAKERGIVDRMGLARGVGG